ncbi:hypothetical protein ABIG06_003158 [Bradyrhizobium sp. USDA 326]
MEAIDVPFTESLKFYEFDAHGLSHAFLVQRIGDIGRDHGCSSVLLEPRTGGCASKIVRTASPLK